MEYKLFKEQLEKEMKKRMGGGDSVTMQVHVRSNDVKRDVVNIARDGLKYSPSIDVRDVYEFYSTNEEDYSVEKIAGNLLRFANVACAENGIAHESRRLAEDIFDWEKVRDRICVCLLNRHMNRELLKDIPSVPFLDMEAVFLAEMRINDDVDAAIRITDEIASVWEVEVSEIFEAGLQNMRERAFFKLYDMADMTDGLDVNLDMLQKNEAFEKDDMVVTRAADKVGVLSKGKKKLYTVLDRTLRNGSAVMLFPEVLDGFAERIGGDIIILPVSVNEVILAEDPGSDTYDHLKHMIREADAWVSETDRLSCSVYKYSRKDRAVSIVK